MPVYEYYCEDCGTKFDALRPMSKANAPIACVKCQGKHTSRAVSLFAARSEGKAISGASGGGGCASCGGGSCSTCGAR